MVGPILKTYATFYSFRFAPGNKMADMAKSVSDQARRVWLPVLKQLRALNIPADSEQYKWVQIWLDFGHNMGFRERFEQRLYDRLIESPRDVPRKHCHWEGCICTDKRPKHSVRICKGCYRVFYCSKQCQKRYGPVENASLPFANVHYIAIGVRGGIVKNVKDV